VDRIKDVEGQTQVALKGRVAALEADELKDPHVTWIADGEPDLGSLQSDEQRLVVRDSFLKQDVGRRVAYAVFASHVESMRFKTSARRLDSTSCLDIAQMAKQWYGAAFIAGAMRTVNEFESRHETQAENFVRWWHSTAQRRTLAEVIEYAWAVWCDKLPQGAVSVVLDALDAAADLEDSRERSSVAAFMADLIRDSSGDGVANEGERPDSRFRATRAAR
ncbi:MAG: hypothetical protein Q7T55_13835, partial [Solirubrobacteraceae bacterium]|nr:hypothetical protein [Solirubrobacteraceae bacterium]